MRMALIRTWRIQQRPPENRREKPRVRIAFVGLPLAALLLARDGHEIVWAGICRKDAIGSRRLVRALGKSKVIFVPDLANEKHVAAIKNAKPDLLVSWFWTKKIPGAV